MHYELRNAHYEVGSCNEARYELRNGGVHGSILLFVQSIQHFKHKFHSALTPISQRHAAPPRPLRMRNSDEILPPPSPYISVVSDPLFTAVEN